MGVSNQQLSRKELSYLEISVPFAQQVLVLNPVGTSCRRAPFCNKVDIVVYTDILERKKGK